MGNETSWRQFVVRLLALYLLAPIPLYVLVVGPLTIMNAPDWLSFAVGLAIGSATGPVLLYGIPRVHEWVYGW